MNGSHSSLIHREGAPPPLLDMLAILFTFTPLGERRTLKIRAAVLYSSDSLDVLGELRILSDGSMCPRSYPVHFPVKKNAHLYVNCASSLRQFCVRFLEGQDFLHSNQWATRVSETQDKNPGMQKPFQLLGEIS